jgi:hypothetical protein
MLAELHGGLENHAFLIFFSSNIIIILWKLKFYPPIYIYFQFCSLNSKCYLRSYPYTNARWFISSSPIFRLRFPFSLCGVTRQNLKHILLPSSLSPSPAWTKKENWHAFPVIFACLLSLSKRLFIGVLMGINSPVEVPCNSKIHAIYSKWMVWILRSTQVSLGVANNFKWSSTVP